MRICSAYRLLNPIQDPIQNPIQMAVAEAVGNGLTGIYKHGCYRMTRTSAYVTEYDWLQQGTLALQDANFYYVYVANAEAGAFFFSLDLSQCAQLFGLHTDAAHPDPQSLSLPKHAVSCMIQSLRLCRGSTALRSHTWHRHVMC